MSNWDASEHDAWGYLDAGRWVPTVDKRSAESLVSYNPEKRKLATRKLGPVEEVKEKK
jgi:hypothetical protein